MEGVIDYWIPIAIVIGTGLGALLTPIIGYAKKSKGNGRSNTIHGAVMIDSSIGRDVVSALDRIAYSTERIEHQLQATADVEAEDRRVQAAIEAARIKWEREQRGE